MPMSKQKRLKRQAKKDAIEKMRWDREVRLHEERQQGKVLYDPSDAQVAEEWVQEDPADPFMQALAEDVRAGTMTGCMCCVATALHDEANRQMRLRRRYGSAWHGRLNFRVLQKSRDSRPRNDINGRKVTWLFIQWMERKGIVQKEKGQMTWVHFYQPKSL